MAAEGRLGEDLTQTRCARARATVQAEAEAEQPAQCALEGLGEEQERTVAEVRAPPPGVTKEHAWPAVMAQRVVAELQCRKSLSHGQAEEAGQESTGARWEEVEQHGREMRQGRFLCAELLWMRDARVAEGAVPFQGW